MQRYESYKPSGIQWVETIPSHWGAERAKWLFNRMERPVRPEDDVVTAFRDGQVTLRTNRRTEGFTNAIQEHGYQGIRKGDLVIHAMDAFAGAIGVSDSDGKSTPVYAACVPRGEYPVNSYYYAYLLRYMAHSGYIESLSKGIRERSTDFRFAEFRELPLPIPDKDEQDRIVAFLDQKTSEIDAAIAKKERLIELLHEQSANLVNHAVTRGLDSSKEPRFSGHDIIGDIPSDWNVRRLKFLSKKIGSGVTPSGGAQNYIDEGVIFIRSQNVYFDGLRTDDIAYIPEKTHKAMGGTQVKNNDVLLNITGASIGRACVYRMDAEANVNQHVCIIRPLGHLDPDFLCCVLNSKVGSQQICVAGTIM